MALSVWGALERNADIQKPSAGMADPDPGPAPAAKAKAGAGAGACIMQDTHHPPEDDPYHNALDLPNDIILCHFMSQNSPRTNDNATNEC